MATATTPVPADLPADAAAVHEPVGRKLHAALGTRIGRIAVWAICLLWTIPTVGLLISSIRPETQVKTTGWWTFFTDPQTTLQNYRDVLEASGAGGNMSTYFWNTVKIAIPSTVIPVVVACLAAYALAWMRFKGRDWVFVGIVALMVVPLQMALVPLLQLFTGGVTIGDTTIVPRADFLENSVAQVWIAHACFALPLAIFLLKNFIQGLPGELIEAARIDGAGHLTIFVRVIVPLAVPAIASLTIFQFLWVWNDLLVGQVFGPSRDVAPMTVRLVDLAGSRGNEWQRLTAGAFVSMIVPLLVFFSLQRFFVRGLTAGAVKG